MSTIRRQLRLLIVASVAAATVVVAPSAMAAGATDTFVGTTSSDWQDGTNWDTGTPPASGDDVVISSCDPNNATVDVTNVPTLALGSLTVQNFDCGDPTLTGASAATTLSAPVVTVQGATFVDLKVLVTAGGTPSQIGDSGALNLSGSSQLNVDPGTSVTVGGTIAVDAGASMTNAGDLVVSSGSDLMGPGSITNAGSISVEGFTDLSAPVTNTGSMSIQGSTVLSAPVTNTGSFVISGGDANGNLRIGAGGTLTTNGSGVFTNNGDVDLQGGTLAGNSTHVTSSGLVYLTADSTLSADLVGTGSIQTYDQSGTPTGYALDGAGTGSITVNDAGIDGQINGVDVSHGGSITGIDITLNGHTYLGGHGNVTGDVTVNDGAQVSPDNHDADGYTLSGLLHVTGDVTFNDGSELSLIARGTGAPTASEGTSQLQVTGATTISQTNTTLSIGTSYDPSGSETVTVIAGSQAPTGTFSHASRNGLTSAAHPDTYPAFPEGLYTTASTSGSDVVATDRVAVITVAAGTVRPGGAFSYTGGGFLPGETVSADLVNPNATTEAAYRLAHTTVTATSTGTVAGSVTVPNGTAAGSYSIAVHGSGGYASTAVTVAAALPAPTTVDPDTDGDGLKDSVDCNKTDKSKPAQGAGVVDADCDGVNDAIQPKFVTGTAGNDKIIGGTGNDRLSGGAGNDSIAGGAGNDVLSGGNGSDKVSGGTGNDKVDGGAGNDRLSGGAGNDKVVGGSGNDIINCGTGKDVATGGTGNDKIGCRDGKGGDVINGGAGRDACYGDRNDRFVSCERIIRI